MIYASNYVISDPLLSWDSRLVRVSSSNASRLWPKQNKTVVSYVLFDKNALKYRIYVLFNVRFPHI